VSSNVDALKAAVVAHLRENQPDEPITEQGRRCLCGRLTQDERESQALIDATPVIIWPSTRAEYAQRITDADR